MYNKNRIMNTKMKVNSKKTGTSIFSLNPSKMVGPLLLFLLLKSGIVLSQQPKTQVLRSVERILKKELVKSGASLPSISTNGVPGGAGFQLAILPGKELGSLKLAGQPSDAFYLKATNSSVYIASASERGVQNGVFWYLQHLGFRYYFPNEAWHVIPKLGSLYKPVEQLGIPSFAHRSIWYAYGTKSQKADADFSLWAKANLQGGEDVNTSHSYDQIVKRNRDAFLVHPEYFAGKVEKGKIPTNPKFEIANEELVQLVIKDAFAQIEQYERRNGVAPYMISLDPSDGGGFSTSAASLKIGGPSEQTFYLANRVVQAVSKKHPSVKFGLYAYNEHAAPPAFEIEPNIVVLVATALNQSKYRTDDLISLWQKKGVTVGLRDYYGVMAWDWDMPGMVAGGKLAYVSNLKNYYKVGIRYVSAETNIGWISRGLGHYTAARLMWDVNADVASIRKEFLNNLYGKAAGLMSGLYDQWEVYKQAVPREGDILKWTKLVEEAEALENDAAVSSRLQQVKRYLYYVYLFQQWKKKGSTENVRNLLDYAARVQEEGIMASYPLIRRFDKTIVKSGSELALSREGSKKDRSQVSHMETNRGINKMRETLDAEDITVVPDFPKSLFMPGEQKAKINKLTSNPVRLRGAHTMLFYVNDPSSASLNFYVGQIKSKNFKTLRLQIFTYDAEMKIEAKDKVAEYNVEPIGGFKAVSLATLQPGSYIAVIDDFKSGFQMTATGAVSYGFFAYDTRQLWSIGRNSMFFDVRQGTKLITLQTDGVLTLQSPTGRIIDLQKRSTSLQKITVGKGEAGTWKMSKQSGKFNLQYVIPLVYPDMRFKLSIPNT